MQLPVEAACGFLVGAATPGGDCRAAWRLCSSPLDEAGTTTAFQPEFQRQAMNLPQVLSPAHVREMVRYLANHQNEDGGYGLHIEGSSTMFGTVLRCGGAATGLEHTACLQAWSCTACCVCCGLFRV